MSGSLSSGAFKFAFECSPIFLVGGVVAAIPGGVMPLMAFTEAPSFVNGILSSGSTPSLDDFFAHFVPLPGSTLIDNQIGSYPFANQAVAANSIIAQPLTLSMMMIVPARGVGGYTTKMATMIGLQTLLSSHNANGGTYVVITPSSFNPNMIMTGMRDATRGQTKQVQIEWQIDFVAPLLTLNQAQSVQNSLMGKLTSGTSISGQPAWSGLSANVASPNAAQVSNLIPGGGGSPAGIASPFVGSPQ
jgi:hypothetical protein